MNRDIHVQIKGLVPTQSGCGVFLGSGDKVIAIFVDHNVAAAITMFLHGIKKPRPLTHDLITNILAGLGAKLQKVVVNDLKDETFYARMYLLQESELGKNLVEVDARPSDSIALAIQQGCPIYVSPQVWEKADDMTWALEQAKNTPPASADEDEGDDEDAKDEPPKEP